MEIPEVNFRTQIAEELSRTELIDRLCEYHEKLKIIKIESYNEAIEDASINVEQTWDPCHGTKIDKESILKLKKSVSDAD